MRDQQRQQQTLRKKMQKGLINLTNQLLKNFHISKILYIFIKVLEHLQMIYFVMRPLDGYHWDYSFMVFFSVFLKIISLDQLFRSNPAIFIPVFYTSFVTITIILVLAALVAANSGWSKKAPFLVKFVTPVVCTFLYLFKTVLVIPVLNVVFVSIIPSISQSIQIADLGGQVRFLGGMLTLFVVVIQLYILTMFREPSPFCELPFAGETFLKGLLWLLLRTMMVIYSLVDLQGDYQLAATGSITGIYLLLIIYSHYQIGLYKTFNKRVELHLLYVNFTFGILHSSDFAGGEVTTLYFIPFLNFINYLACEWILDWQNHKIVTRNLLSIDDSKHLQEHVIYLINLIDNVNIRECKVALEGYIQYHRRDCRIGEDCPCRNLAYIKEQTEDTLKMQAFKLVVSLLSQGRRKFTSQKKIDLLLVLLYHYRVKNSLQAVYAISKMVKDRQSDLVDRLYESYYLQQIEKEMGEMDEKEVSQTSEINKYFDYTNRLVAFESDLESCTNHHVDFWKLILDPNPDIRRLQDLGTLITRSKDQLKNQFESIMSSNPNSIHLLTIYGKFLLEVTNEETYNVKYLEKAESILKNIKESNKIDDVSNKYAENAPTSVVVISGDEGRLGNVVHTNNLVRDLIGYRRAELQERNVSLIMPKIYAEHHNTVLNRYIASSENKVNGHERIVPALTKEGFMLPVTALTKVLPSLIHGIQIAAFITKYQDKSQDEENNIKNNYLLYRSDTEQIMGVCEGCSRDFNISTSLVYGNSLNLNNELFIRHIFGLSFQKSQEGRFAAALEVGEVQLTINTKNLKDEFIINKGGKDDGLIDLEYSDVENNGVEADVTVKIMYSSVYNNIPLKILSICPRKNRPLNSRPSYRKSNDNILQKTVKNDKKRKVSLQNQQQGPKNEADDFKNLKDFKNFISIRREPSAIAALSTICLLFIIIFTSCLLGLIANHLDVSENTQNAIKLYELTMNSELACPEALSQLQKQKVAFELAGSTSFPSAAEIEKRGRDVIELAKDWQLSILPYKYYFAQDYNTSIPEYTLFGTGKSSKQYQLEQAVINNYLSQLETIFSSNSQILANASSSSLLMSNIGQKYSSAKLNMLYSIRQGLNASNSQIAQWYTARTDSKDIVLIVISCVAMGLTILWVILLLPYILSVTKINNRVLSLFTLISTKEISQLIYNCLNFLAKNLPEATVNQDDLEQGLPDGEVQEQSQINQSSLNVGSPSNMYMLSDLTQGEMMKRASNLGQGADSAVYMQQRFQKMINSQDRNKKIVILKFIFIGLLLIAFLLFYLLYGLAFASSTATSVNNYYLVGRRPALIRHAKLLLIEYLIDPQSQPLSLSSIRNLNQNLISEFYIFQASLLFIDLGQSSSIYSGFNNGNVCSATSSYSSYTKFKQAISEGQCVGLKAGVLQKGLKTGIVSILQDIRSILSQYPTTVPLAVVATKLMEYESITKYIETPMLAVQAAVRDEILQSDKKAKLIIMVSGGIFMGILLLCWRLIWGPYLSELNLKIWRTKGLLNLIPMRIITANDLLKNQFTSGQLEKAVR